MGSYLNKPKTDKESEDLENDQLLCGASSMQGWRDKHEVSLTPCVMGGGWPSVRETGGDSTTGVRAVTLARRSIRSSVLLDDVFQTRIFHFTSLGGLIVVYDRSAGRPRLFDGL